MLSGGVFHFEPPCIINNNFYLSQVSATCRCADCAVNKCVLHNKFIKLRNDRQRVFWHILA